MHFNQAGGGYMKEEEVKKEEVKADSETANRVWWYSISAVAAILFIIMGTAGLGWKFFLAVSLVFLFITAVVCYVKGKTTNLKSSLKKVAEAVEELAEEVKETSQQ
jgi:asparagine N-glycosylation enzyme membrane subunit Stt3